MAGVDIIFSAKDIDVSYLVDGATQKKYVKWEETSNFEIRSNGTLLFNHHNKPKCFNIMNVILTKIEIGDKNISLSKMGIKMFCKREYSKETIYATETTVRLIMNRSILDDFCNAILKVSRQNNVKAFINQTVLEVDNSSVNAFSAAEESSSGNPSVVDLDTIDLDRSSYIRKNVVKNLDTIEKTTMREKIRRRRGAFGWLPVLCSNDLVHGSWWFVWGSLLMTIIGIVVLANDFHKIIGEDDSVLTATDYEVSWGLVIASGLFCTIGSLAFVRAMNDPPIRPLFGKSFYHFQTDELFGSWMFFFAVLPAVPYTLIFYTELHQFMYFILFIVSLAGVLGALVFIIACYPRDNNMLISKSILLPCIQCCCCFCFCSSFQESIKKHCATDWLIGTWVIFWATVFSTFAFLLFSIYIAVLDDANSITNFINATSFIDCLLFCIGSAYFCAGSYPYEDKDAIKNDSSSSSSSSSSSISVVSQSASNPINLSYLSSSKKVDSSSIEVTEV